MDMLNEVGIAIMLFGALAASRHSVFARKIFTVLLIATVIFGPPVLDEHETQQVAVSK